MMIDLENYVIHVASEHAGQSVEQKMELELAIAIIRCGCGNPDSHKGTPCPQPRAVEEIQPTQQTGE